MAAGAHRTVRVVAAVSSAFVYLLRCRDGSLYCGWTNDVPRRVEEHRAGRASRYTRSRLPLDLVWSKEMDSRSQAMREEVRIKALPRAQKLLLVDAAAAAPRRP